MGNLPKHRVTLERPFLSCGIDYAGPVLIKCNKGRGTKSTKGYIALFVCLATKAIHIEAVGDLTDSFITAFRGAPRHIYRENGTNFVRARRKLDEIRKLWLSLSTNEAISFYLSKSSIDWHLIPKSSPYFGDVLLLILEELLSTSNHRNRCKCCCRISNMAFGRSGASIFSLPYNLARNCRTHNQIYRKMTSC
ncbi:hypothetical protein TNCT_306561 [Trichonephila clavata]|uniref:Integrase catalytic domain-containing protein n=1 Tax=Trichonephila clavata TaxID=2740835 RepID=A0A8X6HS96_TRICU|nr:hypothetical protein TNCT_306561 [Trichonephila clavata]